MTQAALEASGPAGTHLLAMQPTEAARRETIARWTRDGVARGELVILPSITDEYEHALRKALEPMHLPALPGAVRFRAFDDFLPIHRGRTLLAAAVEEGYPGVRLAGPTDVAMACTTTREYVAQEAVLDRMTRDLPLSVLCTFRGAAALGPDDLDTALEPHAEVTDGVLSTRTETGGEGLVTVTITGDVDADNAALLQAVLARACRQVGGQPLRVDISGMRLLSAAAARALIDGTAEMRDSGGQVALVRSSPVVGRVATLLGLHLHPGLRLEEGR